MRVHQVKLENFRGAKELSLSLHEHLNVFAGINGSGKSSILDATAISLSWLVNRIRTTRASGRPIAEFDIKNGESVAGLQIILNEGGQSIGWGIKKVRGGYRNRLALSFLSHATEAARSIQIDIASNDGQVNLPLFAYYPVNRVVLDIPLRIRARHKFDLLSAYNGSLTSGANFRTFFEWFREREDLENEARRDQQSLLSDGITSDFPDPQLEAVRNALSRFMPDFRNLTVRRNPLRMDVEKRNQRITVNQLSDGEKCLMAMVGDLARRMAIANPLRDDPLTGNGVILIDEIDLHLHPKWQRIVITKLPEVFPNCQFLISTHSPSIITHVRPESLYLLSTESGQLEATRPSESYGKTVDRILEDLMELETTRPTIVKRAISDIYELIDGGKFDIARESIAKLKEQIHDDSDLVKAEVLIKRKELIGK